MSNYSIKQIQDKILEIMMYIDKLCRENDIVYYIMGGTALGAIRHGGFIPWDDDLDIFMTPENYEKFKVVFNNSNVSGFVMQEWGFEGKPLEYAKVRIDGTTFIEENFKDRSDIHHGVYVDIMILHKSSTRKWIKKLLFLCSRYIVAMGLAERNWVPKSKNQRRVLQFIKLLPKHFLAGLCYKLIYRYDNKNIEDYEYCYCLTKAKFKQAFFPKEMFAEPVDIDFENVKLLGPTDIKGYLATRFGNFMKLPSESEQKVAQHGSIVDLETDYREYFKNKSS